MFTWLRDSQKDPNLGAEYSPGTSGIFWMQPETTHCNKQFKSSYYLLSVTSDTHLLGKGSVEGSGRASGYLKRRKCLTIGKVEKCRSYTLPSTRLRDLPLQNWEGGGLGYIYIFFFFFTQIKISFT